MPFFGGFRLLKEGKKKAEVAIDAECSRVRTPDWTTWICPHSCWKTTLFVRSLRESNLWCHLSVEPYTTWDPARKSRSNIKQ